MRNIMSRLLLHIIFIQILFSCNSNPNANIAPQQIDRLVIPKDSTTSYFPFPKYTITEVQCGKGKMDTFVFDWYSKMLFALHEPVLHSYNGQNEIYRFTWLRSFNQPIIVRLQRQGDLVELSSKITNGAGGYEPGQIIWDTAFKVSESNWNVLDSLVDKAKFSTLSTEVQDGGRDGAEWILEGIKNKQYHWAYRWSPSDDRHTLFRDACDYMLKLSTVHIELNKKY
jgi:hypothetical protein